MKKKQLVIIRDRMNVNDSGSNHFERALRKECRKNNIEVVISDSLSESNRTTPTIVMQPSDIASKSYLNVDIETTAEVCYDIINDELNASSLLTDNNVFIYGNGTTIGKPLRKFIKYRDGWWCPYADSKTSDKEKNKDLDDCSIVVLALPYGMKIKESLKGKFVIDCSDSYIGIPDYSVRDIGKLTVQRIIENVKNS